MAHAARALGLGVMLGCMVESGLGIAAGCAVAPLCDHVDLDGNLLLADDPWPGVAFADGVQVPSDEPGPRCRATSSAAAGPRRGLLAATRTTARPRAACCATANGRSSRSSTRRRAGETQAGVPDRRRRSNDALCFGPTTALVGVATQGGRFPPAWRELLKSCIAKGLDVENGLHEFLADDPELAELAARHGVELRDLRRPPADLNVPTGANLTLPAQIVLTVGSDCAIGKMTVSLELDREARARGLASRFVPTGQTGIAIAGWGIAVDAVVSDFIAGAAERLVVEGHERGGELLLVEGQGAVTPSRLLRRHARAHPRLARRTLFVLCHLAGATEVEGYPGHPMLVAAGARRAARADRAARPAGQGRAHRAQHAPARRRRRARAAIAARRGRDRARRRRSGALRRRAAARRDAGRALDALRDLLDRAAGHSRRPPNSRCKGCSTAVFPGDEKGQILKKLTAALALALATGITAGAAAVDFGANDDTGKYLARRQRLVLRPDGRRRPAPERDDAEVGSGGTETDPRQGRPRRRSSRRARRGGRGRPRALRRQADDASRPTAATPTAFAAWARPGRAHVPAGARRFIVGNEPNQPRFWRPQFDARGTQVSAAAFGPVLAATYDALKAVDSRDHGRRRRALAARQRPARTRRATSRPRPSASCKALGRLVPARAAGRRR